MRSEIIITDIDQAEAVLDVLARHHRYKRPVSTAPEPEVAAWSLARDVTPSSSPAAQVGRGV